LSNTQALRGRRRSATRSKELGKFRDLVRQ